MTPREAARLQGFPENFVIPVSDTQAYKQFGNSVSVPVIREIAREMLLSLNFIGNEHRRTSSRPRQLKISYES